MQFAAHPEGQAVIQACDLLQALMSAVQVTKTTPSHALDNLVEVGVSCLRIFFNLTTQFLSPPPPPPL